MFISLTVNIKMGKFVWSCSLCFHETKRKSNVIRHIRLIHGIDSRTISKNYTKKDIEMSATSDDSASRPCMKFCCNRCSYITVKKYNLMRHLKSVHSPEERHQREEESHYTRKEFEEIMTRLRNSVQSPLKDQDTSRLVEAIRIDPEESEKRIREGYFRALEILTR